LAVPKKVLLRERALQATPTTRIARSVVTALGSCFQAEEIIASTIPPMTSIIIGIRMCT